MSAPNPIPGALYQKPPPQGAAGDLAELRALQRRIQIELDQQARLIDLAANLFMSLDSARQRAAADANRALSRLNDMMITQETAHD